MKKISIPGVVLALSVWLGTIAVAQTNQPYPAQNTASNMEAPSGTAISVRTNEAIDSSTASEGQLFSGEVTQDVKGSSGETLIPAGSAAELTVSKISGGGTTGSAEVALGLHSVEVNGRKYLVSSENVTQSGNQGIGKNKRTAEMVGGGALLGTLVGAVAGGGKGAAIGAIAGAGAGGAAQVLTRGKQVKVPAETVLNFTLDKPLRLRSATGY